MGYDNPLPVTAIPDSAMSIAQPPIHDDPVTPPPAEAGDLLRWCDADTRAVTALLGRFGLEAVECASMTEIPGSYFGDSEAGLIGRRIFIRADTPIHSVMHEACHFICLDAGRRANLDTDAGGDYAEEDAVCYLQVLLADSIPAMGRVRMFADMDAWGYTFRLGSARVWFEQDAAEARDWLLHQGLIDELEHPTWTVRH